MATLSKILMAAMAGIAAGPPSQRGFGMPDQTGVAPRMLRASSPEKYPGQRSAHLIGAHCKEGRRLRGAA